MNNSGMHTVASDVTIDVPVRTAYNQWTQFEDFPAFMRGVDRVEQMDDTHVYWQVTVAGVDRGFTAEITEQRPDERIAWRTIDGPRHAGVVTFHRLNDRQCEVRMRLDWEPEGFLEHAGAVFGVDQAQVSADLREFARLMETNGFETGAWRGTVK